MQLPPPPADWSVPYRELADAVGIAPSLEDGYAAAGTFLDPILNGRLTEGPWNPEAHAWTTDGS